MSASLEQGGFQGEELFVDQGRGRADKGVYLDGKFSDRFGSLRKRCVVGRSSEVGGEALYQLVGVARVLTFGMSPDALLLESF